MKRSPRKRQEDYFKEFGIKPKGELLNSPMKNSSSSQSFPLFQGARVACFYLVHVALLLYHLRGA